MKTLGIPCALHAPSTSRAIFFSHGLFSAINDGLEGVLVVTRDINYGHHQDRKIRT